MAYELEKIREYFDEQTQTHHLLLCVVEVNSQGNEIGRSEAFQRAFCLPGEDDGNDYAARLEEVKQKLIARFEGRELSHPLAQVDGPKLDGKIDGMGYEKLGVEIDRLKKEKIRLRDNSQAAQKAEVLIKRLEARREALTAKTSRHKQDLRAAMKKKIRNAG